MVSATLMPTSPFHSGTVRDGPLPASPNNMDKNVTDSKIILQTALKKAQLAVEYDSLADFPNALRAYQAALSLITSVLDSSPSFRSNTRLLNIQSSYLERVTLLSSLVDTSPEMSFLGHDLLSNLERASTSDQYSYTEDNAPFNGSRSMSPSPTPSLKPSAVPGTTLAEGHEVLSSTLDAITSWSRDFDQLAPSINEAALNSKLGSFASQSNSLHFDCAKSPNNLLKQEIPEAILRSRSTYGRDSTISTRDLRWARLSLQEHDCPGSLQLPQMGKSETSSLTTSSLKRRKSDNLTSPSVPKTDSRNPLVFEAEFPKGLQALTLRRGLSAPLPSQFNLDNISFPSNGGLPSEFIPDCPNLDALRSQLSQVQSQSQNSSRRISSLPTTPRPNSFHLAATKVVELAVNDSTNASSMVSTRQAIRNNTFVTIQQVFKEHPTDCVFEPPPPSSELRVFWLLRSLERSMLSGGYLTQKLFIPRSVWVQSGVRLQALETKVHSCEVVAEVLSRFNGLDMKDSNSVLKELEGLDTILNTVQNSLARKLPYIEALRKVPTSALASFGSRISKSVEKLQKSYIKLKSDATSEYVDGLLKLIKASQFLENWYIHFSSLPPRQGIHIQIITRLNRVNNFLSTVFSAFVLRDMSIMLAKYHKRLRASIND